MNKQYYVAGFLFDKKAERVALIQKSKPDWQKGRWNAIGGKIEAGENEFEAMHREFCEETGADGFSWLHFCLLSGDWGKVHFFWACSDDFHLLRSVTEETVAVFPVGDLPDVLPNVRWLIPMAISVIRGPDNALTFEVRGSA